MQVNETNGEVHEARETHDVQRSQSSSQNGSDTTTASHSRLLSDDLTNFPSGYKLTAGQKENLVKESAETAFGKTPSGTSK